MILPVDEVPYFDILDANFSITAQDVHDARSRSWYARTNYGMAVLRYDEVKQLLKHPKLRQGSFAWLSLNGITEGTFAQWWNSWILHQEGQDHIRLRRLLNPSFSAKAVAPLGERFRELATELVDSFAALGYCEFVSEFADPYTARALAILLGIDESEWPVIAEQSTILGLSLGVSVRTDLQRIEAALDCLYGYADRLIAERRDSGGGVVGSLVESTTRPDGLTEQELRDLLVMVIFGGYDTTRNQLGLAMQSFLAHPDQWELLGQRPELATIAVEEVMRVNPTTRWVTRMAVDTFEFNGVVVESGTTLHLFNESAGTDPEQFGPETFDITERRAPQFGFGGGIHHCLGHFVARSDMAQALAVMSSRLRDLRPMPGDEWLPDSGNTGPTRLPLTFTPFG